MALKEYDIAGAFQAVEYELINSFLRNMKRHRVEEVKEQKQWEMWQVKQLQELDLYKKRNAKKYGARFVDINKTVAEMIRLANEEGQMDQETEILEAMKEGLKPKRASKALTAQFFRTNERKLNALIDATTHDMEAAETAILRKANDVYRKTIFNAQVYANTGAGTYEKAVDMATKDLMAAGLTCVEYKNGARHTLPDYADMALRTANKRAYLQGEGAKRQEWGIHTVIVNKRLKACPHCMPFAGKVFIDDVWGGGTKEDGNYPLLSTAIEAGLYHPRCRDSHTAYFPGITDRPGKYTKAEVKAAERAEEKEEKENYARRQEEKSERMSATSIDEDNQKRYEARRKEWQERRTGRKETDEKKIIEGINQNGTDSLLDAYERRREKYGLNLISAEDLKGSKLNNVTADYSGLAVESAEAFNNTLEELQNEYLSGITQIKVADPKETFGATFFARIQANDQVGQRVLVINPHKCKDLDDLVGRIRELSGKGYCAEIAEGMEAEYVATHEFAHGLLNMDKPRKSLIGMNWKSTNKARKDISTMYEEYMAEIKDIEDEISEIKKLPEFTDFNADPKAQIAAFKRLQEAQERLKAVKISKYSMENADEFMAEAFTQNRIGVRKSKYSDSVMEVIDREYRINNVINEVKSSETDTMAKANARFVNKHDKLYEYAERIKKLPDYEDFTCHANPDVFEIDLVGKGNREDYIQISPEEFATRIKNSTAYKGGKVRIISCQAGAKPDGAAQKLANELNVDVLAPTEEVNVDEYGNIFVSDNEILAEMWYNSNNKDEFHETGEWKVFSPQNKGR